MTTKLQINIIQLNEELSNRNIKCLNSEYIGSSSKYLWYCLICNTEWFATYAAIINTKNGCPRCGREKCDNSRRHKIDIEQLNIELAKRNIRCLSPKYLGSREKHEWKCEYGHTWFATYDNIINNGRCCPKCKNKKLSECSFLQIDIEELNKELEKRNIECLGLEYLGSRKKYEWRCLVCNKYWITTYNDIINNETGCPNCAIKRQSEKTHLKFDVIKLNKQLKKRQIECLSKNEDYKNNHTKYQWHCLICDNA